MSAEKSINILCAAGEILIIKYETFKQFLMINEMLSVLEDEITEFPLVQYEKKDLEYIVGLIEEKITIHEIDKLLIVKLQNIVDYLNIPDLMEQFNAKIVEYVKELDLAELRVFFNETCTEKESKEINEEVDKFLLTPEEIAAKK